MTVCVRAASTSTPGRAGLVARLEMDDRTIVKSATQAREGVTGHNGRYVLIVSVFAVIIGFAALWLYFFA